jgi:hypothetical protein
LYTAFAPSLTRSLVSHRPSAAETFSTSKQGDFSNAAVRLCLEALIAKAERKDHSRSLIAGAGVSSKITTPLFSTVILLPHLVTDGRFG